jgi:hypothetical protein
MLCPMVSCGWCNAPLNSSHSIMLHVCRNLKVLQYAELADLAHTAGCEALSGGCCFLCKGSAAEGQPHLCSSILWRLFVIDHSQLPHANPAEDPRVLFQVDSVNIRRHCHTIVHTIFMWVSCFGGRRGVCVGGGAGGGGGGCRGSFISKCLCSSAVTEHAADIIMVTGGWHAKQVFLVPCTVLMPPGIRRL